METWKILIISLAAALALGPAVGIITGKYMVKRAKSTHKPLLTKKERIIYSVSVLVGTGLILFGVFFPFKKNVDVNGDGTLVFDGGAPGYSSEVNGEANPGTEEELTTENAEPAAAASEADTAVVARVSDSIAVAAKG